MKKDRSIKLKAALLLLVFSMNTVVGFACAMGVNMGFNSKHHHNDEEAMEISVNVNDKEHPHHHEEGKHHPDDDDDAMETLVPVNSKELQHYDKENNHHHDDDEEAIEVSVRADDKEHQHHDEETKHHHDSKKCLEKGGCCNDGVIKFQNLEKNLNQNTPVIYAKIFVAILSNFWDINIFNCTKTLPRHYKARVFHPPAPDILIAIQRFQI